MGLQCCMMSSSACNADLAGLSSCDTLLCALEYMALRGARPTLPNSRSVRKLHLPAIQRA